MLTKAQVRTAVREYIDDPGAKTWSDAALDILISMTQDNLWGDILDTASYWNSFYQLITSASYHAPGYLDLRPTGDGGDLTNRLYRIQKFIANGREFYPKDSRDFLLNAASSVGLTTVTAPIEQNYTYEILGDQLWFHPLGTTANPGFIELRYSYRPAAFTSIADGTTVGFVDGCEHALVLTAAANAMHRGDEEDPGKFLSLAFEARQRLFATIRRKYHGPTVPFSVSNPIEMGSI